MQKSLDTIVRRVHDADDVILSCRLSFASTQLTLNAVTMPTPPRINTSVPSSITSTPTSVSRRHPAPTPTDIKPRSPAARRMSMSLTPQSGVVSEGLVQRARGRPEVMTGVVLGLAVV